MPPRLAPLGRNGATGGLGGQQADGTSVLKETRALDDPDAMARLPATFIDGMDGWVDDSLAFARPWGFELATTEPGLN